MERVVEPEKVAVTVVFPLPVVVRVAVTVRESDGESETLGECEEDKLELELTEGEVVSLKERVLVLE